MKYEEAVAQTQEVHRIKGPLPGVTMMRTNRQLGIGDQPAWKR